MRAVGRNWDKGRMPWFSRQLSPPTSGVEVGPDEASRPIVSRVASSLGRLMRLGLFHRANAVPWLYYLFWMMPFVVIGLLITNSRRSIPKSVETRVILGAAALCVITNFLFLRFPLAARVSDATAVTGIPGAWTIAQCRVRLARVAPGRTPKTALVMRLGLGVVVALLTSITLVAAVELGSFVRVVGATRWPQGPSRALEHGKDHLRDLALRPPIARFGRPGSQRHALGEIARYVRDCTHSSDRLLVTWFAPELYFYEEEIGIPADSYSSVRLSPSNDTAVFSTEFPFYVRVWRFDSSTPDRLLTREPSVNAEPRWLPDGESIPFGSNRGPVGTNLGGTALAAGQTQAAPRVPGLAVVPSSPEMAAPPPPPLVIPVSLTAPGLLSGSGRRSFWLARCKECRPRSIVSPSICM